MKRKTKGIILSLVALLVIAGGVWGIRSIQVSKEQAVHQETAEKKTASRRPKLKDGDELESKSNAVTVTVE